MIPKVARPVKERELGWVGEGEHLVLAREEKNLRPVKESESCGGAGPAQ